MKATRYANFRVLREDLEQLKIVAALSRESMVQTFKRLVQQEFERLKQNGGKHDAAVPKDQA
jgi:hypothetical protein